VVAADRVFHVCIPTLDQFNLCVFSSTLRCAFQSAVTVEESDVFRMKILVPCCSLSFTTYKYNGAQSVAVHQCCSLLLHTFIKKNNSTNERTTSE